jgi:hypothetical protein
MDFYFYADAEWKMPRVKLMPQEIRHDGEIGSPRDAYLMDTHAQ